MTDGETTALLQDIVRRESRSLMQYLRDSYPWAPSEEQTTLAQVRRMACEEEKVVDQLGRLLVSRRHAVPYLGPYPSRFTTSNFVAIDFLLPRLTAETRRSIDQLEKDLLAVQDDESKRCMEALLTAKRNHLKSLEGLAAQPVAAAR
jgi:hypothetical protein